MKCCTVLIFLVQVLLNEKAEALLEEVEDLVSVPVEAKITSAEGINGLPATSPFIDSLPSSLGSQSFSQ